MLLLMLLSLFVSSCLPASVCSFLLLLLSLPTVLCLFHCLSSSLSLSLVSLSLSVSCLYVSCLSLSLCLSVSLSLSVSLCLLSLCLLSLSVSCFSVSLCLLSLCLCLSNNQGLKESPAAFILFLLVAVSLYLCLSLML